MRGADLPQASAEAQNFLLGPHRLFIGGEWRDATGERDIVVENPARCETIATIRAASLQDLDAAVAAARHSLDHGWGKLPGS